MELSLHNRRVQLILALVAVSLVIAVVAWPRADTVEGYAYPIPPTASGNSIEVLNGTDRRGLARRATRRLRAAGFDVVFFGNAPNPADSTVILVGADGEELSRRLRAALGAGLVQAAVDTSRHVAATVVLGTDYEPPVDVRP